jgi:hypothetical protein
MIAASIQNGSPRKQCEYRDREGHRGIGCLLEFEPNAGPGGSNRKHCDVCQKLKARDRGAAYVSSYPEKHRKRNRDQRQKAAEAAGRVYRPMDELRVCLYRDRAGNPGPNCIGMFKPRTGGQIFCDKCRPLAINKRQSAAATAQYHADKEQFDIGGDSEACARHKQRLKQGKKSAAAYHERQRLELAALRAQKRPADWSEKPIEWRIIATELFCQETYMSNQELAERLDGSRIVTCPKTYGESWEIALGRSGKAIAINYISDIRKWANRQKPRSKK